MIRTLFREQHVAGDPARVWAFFSTPRNLAAITPPHMRFEIIGDVAPVMYPGQMIEYRIGVLPGVKMRWLTEITHVRDGEYFVDEQRIGPYRLWHHEHRFIPAADGRSVLMTDKITYDPGWGPFGALGDAVWIRRQLAAIFDYRTVKVAEFFPAPR